MLASRNAPAVCLAGGGRAAAAAAAHPTLRHGQLRSNSSRPSTSRSFATRQRSSSCRLPLVVAAADGSPGEDAAPTDAAGELPLWRFLRQQGFSADGISRMQAAAVTRKGRRYGTVTGKRMTDENLQQNLLLNIAALWAEGVDTAAVEQLYVQFPGLLTSTHATFSSSLAALRQLAALLPDDPRTVQAPPGATQLGVALWLYPTAAASLLTRTNLASLIDCNLRLRRQLGISDAATAAALFRNKSILVSKLEHAEAMVAHLQRLQASSQLSVEQVTALALSGVLRLTPAEFNRRWQEGRYSQTDRGAIGSINLKDPAGRQRAAAQGLGELLQAADRVPGLLQPQYRQQGEALVQRQFRLWTVSPTLLHASWASLQELGLSSSQVAAVVQLQPAVLAYSWEGEAKRRLLGWAQQELGLSPYEFLTRHAVYTTFSVATIAMRADYLRQHRSGLYADTASRGAGPLLSLLTSTRRFYPKAVCTEAELAAFNCAWLATPAGRRWGGKVHRRNRTAEPLS